MHVCVMCVCAARVYVGGYVGGIYFLKKAAQTSSKINSNEPSLK